MSIRTTGATSMGKITEATHGKTKIEIAASSPAFTEISPEERHQLIAEAAYLRAEQRSFAPGYELEDWLSAEAEIEMRLSKSTASIR